MAKSKSTKPVSSTAKSAPERGQPSLTARSKTNAKPAARVPGAISSEEIGHVAGDVWGALNRDGGLTLLALKKSVAASPDLVLAAVGWLAREGKLEFTVEGRSLKISLR